MAETLNIYNLDKYNPDDFFIPLTFSLNDFRDLDTRNGVFSKTVKIPGTKKNDSLLGNSFEITAEGFFDRNKRTPAVIERDGIVYLDGSMQLKKVNIRDGRVWEYEIVLYSEVADWANQIKDKNIRDISYSTITFDAASFEASWTNTGDTDEWVVPMIDYSGLTNDDETTNQGSENFRPAVFVYYIFRKIFEGIGYQLKPGVFLKKEFRDLILPYVSEATFASQEELDNNRLEGKKTADQTITDALLTVINNWDATETVDPGSNFTEATGVYVAPYDGTYSVSGTFNVNNLAAFGTDLEFSLYSNGFKLTSVVKEYGAADLFSFTHDFGGHTLTAGDTLYFNVQKVGGLGTNYRILNADFDITLSNVSIQDGVLFDIVRCVPDIRQSQFVKAICQMFNLVPITDSRLKTVEFITRDDFFYNESNADDWSNKLDTSKLQEIEQIEDNLRRDFKFEYQEDENDDNLVEFQEFYEEVYGNKTVKLDNEFLRDDKKIADLPFAGTLMDWTVSGTIYAPKMFNTGFTKTLKPRILIYGGLQDGRFTFDSVLKTKYPFAYSIKNISTPQDISLNFSNLKDISTGLQSNDLGLVDRYYKDQIRQINEGRLYTAYFNLNAVDIVNLDFRKPKLVNGVYYHLNKIEDFLAGKDETTKVELIQVV